jgi:hypothetical protein
MREIFETYAKSVGTLINNLPGIHKAASIKEPLEDMPGWKDFLGRPRTFVESGGRPVLVGTLFGPTGSGKSALFRDLTGIPVPSDLVRPTSYSCIVGAPEGVVDQSGVQKLFPNYRVSAMTTPDVLRDPNRKDDELFCAFYKPPQTNGDSVNLILADVPDFNSIDQGNWARADQMLARAEVVVFMTYAEAYKNERVISYLVTACQKAGHLVYVLNKTPQENAIKIWEDLLKYAKSADRFAEKRHSDNLPLHEFLALSPAYFWPFGGDTVPGRDKLAPIRSESPEFTSFLTGLDAGRVILLSLMEVTPGGVATSRAVLAEASSEKDRLTGIVETVDKQIAEQAAWTAQTQFPVGRWVELVVEIAKQTPRPFLLKPMIFVSAQFYKIIGQIRRLFTKSKNDLRPRKDIEKERLALSSMELVEMWRKANPDLVQAGSLSAENCREARDAFLKMDLPPVGTEWDDFVKERAMKWSRENRVTSGVVATLTDLLAVGGITVLAIDLFVARGVLTAAAAAAAHSLIGMIGLGAAGSAFSGVLIKALKTFGLDGVLQDAYSEWCKARKTEIQGHIQNQFADPLFFKAMKERLAALQSAPITKCMEACDSLEQLDLKFSTKT